MSNLAVHFSSKTDDWATPQWLFDKLNAKYGPFELDVCASAENAKCQEFYDMVDDGLTMGWSGPTYTPQGTVSGIHTPACWMNPPYGREIGKWVKKAYEESQKGCLVVCLLPARTDTKWFHDYCQKGEIEFLRGRLKFGNAKNSAPFSSMIVVFRPAK
jgi:phage N-6-adenine-methyltransferase